jgi:hypothetical protein
LSSPRYLCSQLVALRCGDSEFTVNLEEIWESGAILECEQSPTAHKHAEIRCGGITLCGRLKNVAVHESGCSVEMEFSPLTPWSLERFEPAHMLNPADLAKGSP